MTKRAEESFRTMMAFHGYNWHKYGDVRYCANCHALIPKSELKPDYSAHVVYTWVEAKNSNATGRWEWKEISPEGDRKNQRQWLQEHGGWLFIELGTKPAPKGKIAFLIPWSYWEQHIEPVLIEKGYMSIRMEESGKPTDKDYRLPAVDLLGDQFVLDWLRGQGWVIPAGHPWWRALDASLRHNLERIQKYL